MHILADLWNSPDAANTLGNIDDRLPARPPCWAAWRCCGTGERKAAGKSTDKPNMITGLVQICWHKSRPLLGRELREIPMEGDRLLMTPQQCSSAPTRTPSAGAEFRA